VSSGDGWLRISFFSGLFVKEFVLGGDVFLVGVEGRLWLGVVCRGCLFGVYFGCSTYIQRL